jgi:hypothetical protein
VDRSWLRILKLRGGETSTGQHSFHLTDNGFGVFPRLESALPTQIATTSSRAGFR